MMFNNWKFFALASAFFAALTAILGKLGVSAINSNMATFIRTIIILLFISLTLTIKKEWILPEIFKEKSFLFLVLSGVATACSWLCYYRAMKLGPASKVAPLDKLSVIITILLASLFLGEKLQTTTIIGGLFVTIGAIILTI